jgi:hypothetical protein
MLIIQPQGQRAMKKIAVFIGNSLFAQGALSYLKSHSENNVEVCSFDVFKPSEALEKLKVFSPDIVIIEAQYLLIDPLFSPTSILALFPHLTILELHINSPVVEIIRREQCEPASFEELISSLGINKGAFPADISIKQVK